MVKEYLIASIVGLIAGALIFTTYASFVHIREINVLEAQLETFEPELPSGVMKALDERTITNLDIFCADWRELRSEEQ